MWLTSRVSETIGVLVSLLHVVFLGKVANDYVLEIQSQIHNAKEDRLTTAKIRKAIIADKDLSTYAHNIKIITTNGSVTLKGPVKSEDEKEKVASDAAGVVSADRITNNLTVKQ